MPTGSKVSTTECRLTDGEGRVARPPARYSDSEKRRDLEAGWEGCWNRSFGLQSLSSGQPGMVPGKHRFELLAAAHVRPSPEHRKARVQRRHCFGSVAYGRSGAKASFFCARLACMQSAHAENARPERPRIWECLGVFPLSGTHHRRPVNEFSHSFRDQNIYKYMSQRYAWDVSGRLLLQNSA